MRLSGPRPTPDRTRFSNHAYLNRVLVDAVRLAPKDIAKGVMLMRDETLIDVM